MTDKKYSSYKPKNNKAPNPTKNPTVLIPPAPNYPSPTDTPDDKQEAFDFFFPDEEKTPPYESYLPHPVLDQSPYPAPPKINKVKAKPKESNFVKVDEKGFYYKLEHKITKERKWIHKKHFNSIKLPEVFYDQDSKFVPISTGSAKW